jgi:prepilin-type N-terminal cleavage/methylation domain-containing protein
MKATRWSRRRGFGLTEVMVAVTIMGTMIMAVYAIMLGSLDGATAAANRLRAALAAQEALEMAPFSGKSAYDADVSILPGYKCHLTIKSHPVDPGVLEARCMVTWYDKPGGTERCLVLARLMMAPDGGKS